MGTILGVFGILNVSRFFEIISKTRPYMEHWAKKIWKNYPKTCSKHVWTLLGTTLGFFAILKIFDFLRTFRRLDPPWNTGQKYFIENINPKHVQSTFGQSGSNFGRFWNFEIFLIFWKHFEDSTLHGTLGKKTFRKIYPKTCWKHVWTLLGTILGILENLNFFKFF